MKSLSLVLGTLLMSSIAAAGPGDGGGGKGIVCKQADGSSKVYLADTFKLARSGELDGLKPSEPRAIVAAAALAVDAIKPAKIHQHPYLKNEKVTLGYLIAHRRAQLSFMPYQKIADLNDDNIDVRTLPAGCTKVQLAVQDVREMRVDYAAEENELSWAEQGFLQLHETLVSLRGTPGADTTPIRRDVEEIAKLMHAPNSSLKANILALIKAERIPYASPTKAGDDLAKYCKSYTIDVKPQPNDTPEISRCRQISAQLSAEAKLHDVSTSVPTVLRAPKQMTCVAGSIGENSLKVKKPTAISLAFVKGTALPGGNNEENTYAINVDGTKITSKRVWFTTQRTMREAAFRAYGATNLQAFFVDSAGKNVTVHLRNYDDYLGTFEGSIEFADPTKLSYPNASYFGLNCFTGKLPMGLDLENSEPSSRKISAPKAPISQLGCKSILLADVTRAQYKHDVAVLNSMYLKNPLNYIAVKKWIATDREFFKPSKDDNTEAGWNRMLDLKAKLAELEKNPAVQQYFKVRVIGERPLRCVEFRGE